MCNKLFFFLTRVSPRVQWWNLICPEHRESRAADIVAAVYVEQRVALVRHGLDAVLVQDRSVHLQVALVGEFNVLETGLLRRSALERFDLAETFCERDLSLIV